MKEIHAKNMKFDILSIFLNLFDNLDKKLWEKEWKKF